jgi:hypothetical protein
VGVIAGIEFEDPPQHLIYRLERALSMGFSLQGAQDVVRLDSHLVEKAVRMARTTNPDEWEARALWLLGARDEEMPW